MKKIYNIEITPSQLALERCVGSGAVLHQNREIRAMVSYLGDMTATNLPMVWIWNILYLWEHDKIFSAAELCDAGEDRTRFHL